LYVRIDLPSKQADGSPNYVDLREIDDLLAEDLFAIHRAVRLPAGGENPTYSPREMDDDSANAFLGRMITAWSFPSPVPIQNGVAAHDVTIGRAMRARDWSVLRRKIKPLIDELEGFDRMDPKEPSGS
jgi:hypothetical protein